MTSESDQQLDVLIQNLPDTAEVLALRTAGLARSGEWARAEQVLRRALASHDIAPLRITLGRLLMDRGRHKEAMTEMVAVLRVHPENPTALVQLASCLLECGELVRGGKMLEKAAAAGASARDVNELQQRFQELVKSSDDPAHDDLTLPEGATAAITRPGPDALDDARAKHRTLMGRPNPAFDVGDPRGTTSGMRAAVEGDRAKEPTVPAPPAPLQSGTFAGLDLYGIDGDPDDDMDATVAQEAVRMADGGPVILNSANNSPFDDANEYASPDEYTQAITMSDTDIAAPDDATGYLIMEEGDYEAADTQSEAPGPIHYDPGFVEEAQQARQQQPQRQPPADLDQLPDYDTSLPRMDGPHVEEDPTARNLPPTREDRLDEYSRRAAAESGQQSNLPGLDPGLLFDDLDGPQSGRNRGYGSGPSPHPSGRQQPMQRGSGSGRNMQPGSGQQPQPNYNQGSGQQPQPNYNPGSGQQPQANFNTGSGPHQQPPAPQQHNPQQMGESGQQHFRPSVGSGPVPQPRPQQQMPDSSFGLEGNSVPVESRWQGGSQPGERREPTALAAHPKDPNASRISGSGGKRVAVFVIAALALISAIFLGLAFTSARSLNTQLNQALVAATEAQQPDTFNGYQTAELELVKATKLDSYMGAGFDDFVQESIPLPGLNASNLRREAVARLAAVAALVEYRFEEAGSREAGKRLEAARAAAPDSPMTAVAAAFVAMGNNQPHIAVEVLEDARAKHPSEFALDAAQAWALLEMERVAEAAKLVQPLRSAEELTPGQKYLLASVDAARGDKDASKKFAEVFAASANHVDSRIARSYVLRDGEADYKRAENVLAKVTVNLKREASRFQKARAKSAYGSLRLATGDKKKAEELFKEAITKMPSRSELYMPLLDFYLSEGRTEDVEKLLAKAREEKAYSPTMGLFEARVRLLESRPEQTVKITKAMEFQDVRTAFLQGLALLDQSEAAKAVKVLDEGQKAPGDNVDVRALYFLARSRASDDAVEDSVYQLERIKSKAADDPEVHWASALTNLVGAAVTTSKSKRSERLKEARKELQRAIELRPNWPLAHVGLCDVYQNELSTEKAEAACLRARALAPSYVPAIVSTARLRLMQGRFEDAQKLAEEATKIRSQDPVVGLLNARVAIEQRRLDDARAELNRWLGKSVDPYELSLLEGRLEFTRENYAKAAGYLKQAFEMRPNDGEASIYYGHTLARLGQFGSADDILLKFLSHPTWAGYAWATLGEVRRKQRRFKDAFENLAKARRIYSDQVIPDRYWSHLYAQYALTYKDRFRKWRHPKVWQMLKLGRKKGDPMDPELNMTFGNYFLKKRRPNVEAATRSFEKVVEVAPFRCDAIDYLIKAYEEDDKEEKLAEMQKLHTENCAEDEQSE